MGVTVTRTLKDYADLLDRPAPRSSQYVAMTQINRAAQFAAYKSLNGFEDMVGESGRLTEEKPLDYDEGGDPEINQRLGMIYDHLSEHPEVTVIWFRKDERKPGGRTEELTGRVKRIDTIDHRLYMLAENGISDGPCVALEDITRLEGEIFDELFW